MSDEGPALTVAYKSIGDLEILLDIYLPDSPGTIPILLYFHGGALLQGNRKSIPYHIRRGIREHGYACISADYRLAPQASIYDILDDVLSCIAFIRDAAGLFNNLVQGEVDVTRLAVCGSCGGGLLALLAGLYAQPKPNLILCIHPITDPLGLFFVKPRATLVDVTIAVTTEMKSLLTRNAEVVTNRMPTYDSLHGKLYMHALQSGIFARLLGITTTDDGEPFRIARQIYDRGMPPAYFLHGDEDTFVGVEQSDEVVGAMALCGIHVEYERVRGRGHLLNTGQQYDGTAMYEFLKKYL